MKQKPKYKSPLFFNTINVIKTQTIVVSVLKHKQIINTKKTVLSLIPEISSIYVIKNITIFYFIIKSIRLATITKLN